MLRAPTALLLVALLSPVAVAAQPAGPPCATPRRAVDGLLYWQQPEHTDLEKAAACLDVSRAPAGVSATERARQIKEILDARGLYVHLEEIPDDPAYADAAGGGRVALYPKRLPQLELRKAGDRWLWSADTVAAVPALYRETFSVDLGGLERHLPRWARGDVLGVQVWKLGGLLLLILLGLVVRLVTMLFVASQARRIMTRLGAKWGEEILARVDNPIGTLAATGVGALLLPGLHLPVRVAQVGLLALQVLAAFSVVWMAYRLVDVVTGWLQQKAEQTDTKLDDQLVPLVRTALKIFIVALGVIFILQNLDVDVGSLLAGLGLGGLAFALAARDTVANLFGAVTIFLDRPFQIGDWVVMAGVEGVIERVGFRSTRVRTFYNSLVAVPNSKVADAVIDNYGERLYRRTVTSLGVTYDTDPDQLQAFVEGIRAIIRANPYTRKDYYEVHFNDFGDNGLKVMVYFFFKVASWSEELRERHRIFLEILRLAKDLNVDFAFPTRTLHLETFPEMGTMPSREAPEDLAAVVDAYGPGGVRAHPEGPRITGGWFAGSPESGSTRDDTSDLESA